MCDRISTLKEAAQLMLAASDCGGCPHKEEIDANKLFSQPDFWEVLEGMPPVYCPLHPEILALVLLVSNWVKNRCNNKSSGKPLSCGIKALVSKVGDFFRGKVYYLHGDIDLMKSEAIKIARNWVTAGKKIACFYDPKTKGAEESLKALNKDQGYGSFPDFVRLDCFAQLVRLVKPGQYDAIVISRSLEFPASFYMLKGIALTTDTVILGIEDTPTQHLGEMVAYTDAVIAVRAGTEGNVIYEKVMAKKQ